MKIKEIEALRDEQIQEKLKEIYKELIKLNAQAATGTAPKSPGMIKKNKKTIARLLTIKAKKAKEKIVVEKKENNSKEDKQ
ncbi:50S ribosomal protein L29 [Candidatus Woesearchaeota archaeon]|jgi:ribosomal protein L29|nr:50S ribosomal protein L29 [Candidatus Woesearchaeota archaeon]MBT6520312.1 50S ribosomal protein L29 [Candidatus Woesearchaeota archaeon]MBT7368265.1 50S ribosomal protein L29 [Candidatus Woesearchaeota archaeon]